MARKVRLTPHTGTADQDILFPDRPVFVRGVEWTMRELSVLQAARMTPLADRYREARDAGGTDEGALCYLIAEATGHAVIEVAGLDPADFARLVEAWDAANLHVFARAAPIDPQNVVRWGDMHAELVANGHLAERIGNYTARQILLHYEAAMRRTRTHRAALLSDVNHAFAGGTAAEKQIQRLKADT